MKDERKELLIEELLGQLTLEEKIDMIHGAGLFRTEGVERLEIPPLYMSDGPMGVRAEFADHEWRNVGTTEDFVSYMPCNSAIASTWNTEVAELAGEVLGEEARGRGKDIILAPGINIKRSPLCGRNFEYMSEDPRLIEELVVPMIKGVQKYDVAACVKHFAANSQETERLWVDTIIDRRTLEEIYFPGFKAAVEKGGVFSLMGAYNLLNGEHCCTSKSLLNKVLRKEWGFDGMIVSDWGGVHDTKLAAESALDIEMDVTDTFDKHNMAQPLFKAVKAGKISETCVDEKIRNILRLMLRLHMLGENKEYRCAGAYNTEAHRRILLDAARESVILLKNEEKLLPLDEKKMKKVAVIGQNAAAMHSNGGGSAQIKALYEISPLMGIKKLLGGNTKVCYAPGYVIPGKESKNDINWQADSTKQLEEDKNQAAKEQSVKQARLEQDYRDAAIRLASDCDTVIFVGGLNHDYDLEGQDRSDMKLPYGQDALLEALLDVNPNVIIVIYAGSPVEMPWVKKARAIVWSYYAGMEGGTAIAEVLFGRVNPSGKLAETMICESKQCSAHVIGTFAKKDKVEYKEGVMVGYRYYDTQNIPVNFCFGHGLSYTKYEYSKLEVEHGDDNTYRVRFFIKNIGEYEGSEVAQLYVKPLNSKQKRPMHELKAFTKVFLKRGEEKRIEMTLNGRDFTYYDLERQEFVIEPCEYEIEIGVSSRDIRLCHRIVL